MTDIGKEYGTALFMLACEENKQKDCEQSLEKIKNTFLENPQYPLLLSSPSIPLKERLGIIEDAFYKTVPQYVLSFLKLMCEKGRISYFMESVDEYKALLNASEHIANAKITSAVELTAKEKENLINALKSKEKCQVDAEYFVDSTLLGGLIVEIDGKIMDGSLRHRLYEVKEVMNT